MDWGTNQELGGAHIFGPGTPGCLETEMLMTGTPASTAVGTANQAIFIPFVAQRRFSWNRFYCINGATVAGNVDIGVYDAEQNLLNSTGATAQAGTSALQSIAPTVPASTPPGLYYVGMTWTNATATFLCGSAPVAGFQAAAGILSQSGLGGTLPNPATWVTSTLTIIPIFGLCSTSFR